VTHSVAEAGYGAIKVYLFTLTVCVLYAGQATDAHMPLSPSSTTWWLGSLAIRHAHVDTFLNNLETERVGHFENSWGEGNSARKQKAGENRGFFLLRKICVFHFPGS